MSIPFICVYHRRAGKVTTHRAIANIKICVPENQVEEYAKHHPRETILPHPDSVIGLMPKRQWIYDKFGDNFQVDDDVIAMYRTWRPMGSRKGTACSAQRAYEVIQQHAETAKQLGAYLFCFAGHAHPLTYNPMRPFRFGGYTYGAAFGLLAGSKIKLTDCGLVEGGDYWLSLINAYHHRYCFIDSRFSVATHDSFAGVGGVGAGPERVAREKEASRQLKRMFGDAIRIGKPHPTQISLHNKMVDARTVVLPYEA
jgi:hypothetical protein